MNRKMLPILLLVSSLSFLTGCDDGKQTTSVKKPEPPHYPGYEQIKREAEQGSMSAQYNLGQSAQTPEEALHWFSKAAEQGNSDAQFFVGRMYQNGVSVPANKTLAIEWYKKSAAQGNQNAIDALKSLDPKTPAPASGKKTP